MLLLHRYKKLGLGALIASAVVTVALFVLSKGSGYPWGVLWSSTINQLSALLGTLMLCVTFVLSSRAKWLEGVFGGLDVVYKLHQLLGKTAYIALLLHPTFILISFLPAYTLILPFLTSFSDSAKVFGQIALLLLTILIVATLFIRMPYHIWKQTHQWMGLVLLLAALHVFTIASDVASFLPLRIWMLSWIGVAIASYSYRTFFYQRFAPHSEYTIDQVTTSHETTQLTLTPTKQPLAFAPGQFVFLEVVAAKSTGVTREKHPFSIASGVDDQQLVLWCKNLGDYTSQLPHLKAKTKVLVYGPYGAFFDTLPVAKQVVGIAGGIGITPFLSLLQSPKQTSKPITIVHSCKQADELPSWQLPKAAAQKSVRYVQHESEKQGRITAQMVTKLVEHWKQAHYYLCGPLPMMISLRTQLMDLGVRPSRIIFEDFSLRS